VVCAIATTDSGGYNDLYNHWSYYFYSEEEMKIELELYRENEDGSTDFNINLDGEAIEFLVRKAIMDCVIEGIEAGKRATPTEETE
jgi:hypothetical protein